MTAAWRMILDTLGELGRAARAESEHNKTPATVELDGTPVTGGSATVSDEAVRGEDST